FKDLFSMKLITLKQGDVEWAVENVWTPPPNGNDRRFSSFQLAVDDAGEPHVVAHELEGSPGLVHFFREASAWNEETIPTRGQVLGDNPVDVEGAGSYHFFAGGGRLTVVYPVGNTNTGHLPIDIIERTTDGWAAPQQLTQWPDEFAKIHVAQSPDGKRTAV